MRAPAKTRNQKRHATRAAKSHIIYTTSQVLDLYGIAERTLTHWLKLGLPYTRGRTKLFLEQDLNAFRAWFKRKGKLYLGRMEAYCLYCKQAHSGLDTGYVINANDPKCIKMEVNCPVTNKLAYKIISARQADRILKESTCSSRAHQDDCTETLALSKTAFFDPALGAIKHSWNIKLK